MNGNLYDYSTDGLDNIRAGLVLNDMEKQLIRQAGIVIQCPKDYVLFSAGDVSDHVYLIESGWVKIYRISADGKRVTVGSIRGPGEMVGLAETFLDINRTCFAGTISKGSMVVLSKTKFEEIMGQNSFFTLKVIKSLAARMREAEAIIHEMVCCQALGRLAIMLMKMGERMGEHTKNGIKINLHLTHEEIASMVGISRQTVTSALNTFKQEKSITFEGRMIRINPDKLAKWLA
jgi:CRP-like cAMP-binding protein